MGRKRKQWQQAHGLAWCRKQNGCWHYAMPGTNRRTPLVDENGNRIRGKENRQAAELALSRVIKTGSGLF